jgi:hypothetical protein
MSACIHHVSLRWKNDAACEISRSLWTLMSRRGVRLSPPRAMNRHTRTHLRRRGIVIYWPALCFMTGERKERIRDRKPDYSQRERALFNICVWLARVIYRRAHTPGVMLHTFTFVINTAAASSVALACSLAGWRAFQSITFRVPQAA